MKKEIYVSVSTDPINEFQLVYEYAKELQGTADFLHCDIMDGKFVPRVTFDHQLVNNINQNSAIMLDVHLMCDEPLKLIDEYIKAGANIITVHYEAFKDKEDLLKAVKKIKNANILAGISINPKTSLNEIRMYLHMFDIVLIMSVEPGASGQKFLTESLDKIKNLNNIRETNNFKFKIEVDGGVNNDNLKDIVEAGVDMIVSGSYIYKSKNRKEAIQKIKSM